LIVGKKAILAIDREAQTHALALAIAVDIEQHVGFVPFDGFLRFSRRAVVDADALRAGRGLVRSGHYGALGRLELRNLGLLETELDHAAPRIDMPLRAKSNFLEIARIRLLAPVEIPKRNRVATELLGYRSNADLEESLERVVLLDLDVG